MNHRRFRALSAALTLLACTLAASSAHAEFPYCSGTVDDYEVKRNGRVYLDGSWNKSSQLLCSLDGSWPSSNPVPADVCKAWLLVIQGAHTSGDRLTVKYVDVPSYMTREPVLPAICSALQSYAKVEVAPDYVKVH